MNKKKLIPAYMKIAIDMAARISREEFEKDVKISGRTTLASYYNVSPETIRKAMRLLTDMNIVEVKYGNGIYVASYENAEQFIERYRTRESINELKEKLLVLMNRRKEIEEEMNDTMKAIIDYTSRFKHSDSLTIYEIVVPKGSPLLEKSIQTMKIWHNTGATIVGIKRSGHIILSPGPYEVLENEDRILYVGEPNCIVRIREFLTEGNEISQ